MRYGQRPGVSATEIDGDVFLVEPGTEEVFYLNAVAGGLWRALAEPMDLAALTALMMPFTYSIANGLAFGFISYAVLKTATGRARDVHPATWLVAVSR